MDNFEKFRPIGLGSSSFEKSTGSPSVVFSCKLHEWIAGWKSLIVFVF